MRVSIRRFVALGSAVLVGGLLIAAGHGSPASAVPTNQTVYVTGTGPGGGPHVKVFSQEATERASFFAYNSTFSGGVNVALGDINNDGRLEIITGAGPGGGPHVRVFTDHGQPLDAWSFFAYSSGFAGGVNVAAADVNDDGDDEIIVAPVGNGGPHVKVYDIVNNTPTVIAQFMAYDPGFTGGVSVTGLDGTDGKTFAVAPGRGGGPHVKACTVNGCNGGFFAYLPNYFGGINLSHLPTEQGDIILTASMENTGHVRGFEVDGTDLGLSFFAFPGLATGANIAGIADPENPSAFLVAPYRGVGAATGRDDNGQQTPLSINPYPGFGGGTRIAAAFGSFDNNPVPTTTTSTSTTTTSTSTTTTSTTVPPTTTTTEAPTTTTTAAM
jgi:hypothetical protein